MPDSVLVSGGTGFVGSNLVPALSEAGHEVAVLVHTQPNKDEIPPGVEVHIGDVTNLESLPPFAGYDVVIHLAGVVSVQGSVDDPVGTFRSNTLGAQHVFERARLDDVDEIIYLSSGAVYGNPNYLPIDESHPTECLHPYASSKLAGENVAEAYANAYDISVVTLRGFTLYGPGQDTDNLVPTVIEQIEAGSENVSLGNVEPTRDFTYIDDLTSAIVTVIQECDGQYEVYNVGSGNETTVRDLVNEIIEQIDPEVTIESEKEARASDIEIQRMVADVSKLRRLGWEPEFDIEGGIEVTVERFEMNDD